MASQGLVSVVGGLLLAVLGLVDGDAQELTTALGPGKVTSRAGWTVSLRAEAFPGTPPESVPYYSQTGPITASLTEYPVIILEGPGKARWEYSTLYRGSLASAVLGVHLESDWDGDGRPEVVARLLHGYQLGSGIKPSGFVSMEDRILLPGKTDWKGTMVLGSRFGDEEGGEVEGLAVSVVQGRPLEPVRWIWSEGESAAPGARVVSLKVVRLVWRDGDLVEVGRSESGGQTLPDGPRVVLADDRVNLRSGPGTGFLSSGLLSRGTVLVVKGLDAEPGVSGYLRSPWLYVEPAAGPLAGQSGWVFAHFCSPAF